MIVQKKTWNFYRMKIVELLFIAQNAWMYFAIPFLSKVKKKTLFCEMVRIASSIQYTWVGDYAMIIVSSGPTFTSKVKTYV